MKNFRKFAAILLSLVMLVTSVPRTTFAADTQTPTDAETILQLVDESEEEPSEEAIVIDASEEANEEVITETVEENSNVNLDIEPVIEEETAEEPVVEEDNDEEVMEIVEEVMEEETSVITEGTTEEEIIADVVAEPETEEVTEEVVEETTAEPQSSVVYIATLGEPLNGGSIEVKNAGTTSKFTGSEGFIYDSEGYVVSLYDDYYLPVLVNAGDEVTITVTFGDMEGDFWQAFTEDFTYTVEEYLDEPVAAITATITAQSQPVYFSAYPVMDEEAGIEELLDPPGSYQYNSWWLSTVSSFHSSNPNWPSTKGYAHKIQNLNELSYTARYVFCVEPPKDASEATDRYWSFYEDISRVSSFTGNEPFISRLAWLAEKYAKQVIGDTVVNKEMIIAVTEALYWDKYYNGAESGFVAPSVVSSYTGGDVTSQAITYFNWAVNELTNWDNPGSKLYTTDADARTNKLTLKYDAPTGTYRASITDAMLPSFFGENGTITAGGKTISYNRDGDTVTFFVTSTWDGVVSTLLYKNNGNGSSNHYDAFYRDPYNQVMISTDGATAIPGYGYIAFDVEAKGYLTLEKTSADASLSGNSNYSLAGAQYTVTNASGTAVGTLTTDAQGKANTLELVPGNYTVLESVASKGYSLDPTPHPVTITGSNTVTAPYVVNSIETPVYGYARVVKSSGNTAISGANPTAYSLAGAIFGVYTNSNCTGTPVATMTTISSGITNMVKLPYGNYWVKEDQAPSGYLRNTEIKPLTIAPANTQSAPATVTYPETPKTGSISLEKVSAVPEMTNVNSCYSLAGAQYTVKNSSGTVVGTLTTTANGTTNTISGLPIGRYTIVETVASKGFTLDLTPHYVDITADNYATVQVAKSTETPLNDPVSIVVEKINATEGVQYNLAGTRFKVEYFDGYYTAEELEGKTATRSWVIETAWDATYSAYRATLDSAHLVTALSNSLYLDAYGFECVPLGTIRITEYSPATGFQLDPTIFDGDGNNYGTAFVAQVTAAGIDVSLNVGANRIDEAGFVISDSPVRGDFELYKTDERYGTPMANVDFLVQRLDAEGKPMEGEENSFYITTDEDGYYTTVDTEIWVGDDVVDHTLGALPYGRYMLTELSCDANEKYEDHEPVYFAITEHGAVVTVNMTNHLLPYIGTTLTDDITNDHVAEATTHLVYTDKVAFNETHIGDDYQMVGEAHWVSSGEPVLDKDGNVATGTTSFVPDEEDGYIYVHFDFEVDEETAERLKGETVVAFEDLYRKIDGVYTLVASHRDLTDESQWIHFVKITSTASSDNGTHFALIDANGVLHDEVPYENAIPGTYELVLTGMKRVPVYAEVDEPEVDPGDDDSETSAPADDNNDSSAPAGENNDSSAPLNDDNDNTGNINDDDDNTGNNNDDSEINEDEEEEEVVEELDFYSTVNGDPISYEIVPTDIEVRKIVTITEEDAAHGVIPMEVEVDLTQYDGTVIVFYETMHLLQFENEDDEEPIATPIVAREENIMEEAQTIYVPSIHTMVWDDVTLDHMSLATKDAHITDRVFQDAVKIGEEYTTFAYGVNSEDEPILDENGDYLIQGSRTFIADSYTGYTDVHITYDATKVAGTTFTIVEELYWKDILIAVHHDVNCKEQQISVPDMQTTFTDDETQTHTVALNEKRDFTDTVKYGPVIADGRTYGLRTYMADQATGELLLDENGEPYTLFNTFVPEDTYGEIKVTFKDVIIPTTVKTIVCFETLTNEDESIIYAIHADLEDEAQSVRIGEVSTTAKDKETGTDMALLSDDMTIVDTVDYSNAVEGETTVVKSVVMIRNEEKDEDGNITVTMKDSGVAVTKTVVMEENITSVDIEVPFDGTKIIPDGGILVIYEYIYVNGVLVAQHTDPDSLTQRIIVPTIKTNASDTATENHLSCAADASQIKDDVDFSYLITDRNFQFSLNFFVVEDKEQLKNEDGTLVTYTELFKPTTEFGTHSVIADLPAEVTAKLIGKTVVCQESLIYMGKVVAVHDEVCDEQSIYFPSMKTTATVDGAKTFEKGQEKVTVTDLVEFNLFVVDPTVKFKLVTSVMDKTTGLVMPMIVEVTELDENGKEVKVKKVVDATSSLIFTATDKDFKLSVEIPVSLKEWKGEDLVVFEWVYELKPTGEVDKQGNPIYEEVLLIEHADLSDIGQTVSTAINTGITDHLPLFAVCSVVAIAAGMILFFKARKKEEYAA